MRGIILLGLAIGSENRVLKRIRSMKGVTDAFMVYGEYDGVVLFDMAYQDELNSLIANIRRIEGTTKSVTLVAM